MKALSSYLSKYWYIAFLLIVVVFYLLPDWSTLTSTKIAGDTIEWKWSVMVSQGQSIYPYEDHFVGSHTCIYPPMFMLVLGNLMKVFGTSPILGKVVSFVAVIVTALFAYLVTRRVSGRPSLSLIAPLLILLHPTFAISGLNDVKIDQLGVMFSAIALYLVVIRQVWWSIPFIILAVYTKQSFIALPIAVFIYLLLREWRSALSFGLTTVGVGVIVLVFAQYSTNDQFWTHIMGMAMQSGSISLLRIGVGTAVSVGLMGVPFCLAVLYLVKTKDFKSITVWYFFIAFLVLLGTIGKWESGINYSFEVLVAASILSVLALDKVFKPKEVVQLAEAVVT
jgi:hypothetical protein